MMSDGIHTWGKDPHALLTLEEAWRLIAAHVRPLPSETVPFERAAGRVLASPIVARDDDPAFDKSMMDGFAVRAADCSRPGAELEIVGLAPAGALAVVAVASGQAMKINTGAPIPGGADSVVRIEDTAVSDDGNRVTIQVAVREQRHIAGQGSNLKRHDIVLAPPLRLGPAQLAAVATAGADEIDVYPEVTAAIATTGDELVPVGTARKRGQIFESNGPMLEQLVGEFGATGQRLGIVRDDPADLQTKMSQALAHPVVIAVGGMSMGTLDLVPSTFASLGVEWKFHGVFVRPGKPVAYGLGPEGQHVFGLPGNPVSAFVCAWLFVRMAIRGLQGHPVRPPHRWRATLTKDLEPGRDARPAYLPARVWNSESRGMLAEPCAWGGAGDPFGLALSNALLVRDDPKAAARVGDAVEFILISPDP